MRTQNNEKSEQIYQKPLRNSNILTLMINPIQRKLPGERERGGGVHVAK